VVRGSDGELRAFFNVCRHHATILNPDGEGNKQQFTCCYHGWTYGLDGKLLKATRLKGIKDFTPKEFGLRAMPITVWGPFVFIWPGEDKNVESLSDILQPVHDTLNKHGYAPDLSDVQFLVRKTFTVNCNWKLVNDNYLDGEYHIPYVHTGLNSALDMSSYKIECHPKVSMQIASPSPPKAAKDVVVGEDFSERIGDKGAVYALMYPTFAINRYGPVMDSNHVIPLSHDKTLIIFDYYYEASRRDDKDFVEKSLAASIQVQDEDTIVCELLQRGLLSRGYGKGRYAPVPEAATFHFHQHLAADLQN